MIDVDVKCLLVFFFCVILNVALLQAQKVNFKVIRQWKYINYTWPTSESYQAGMKNGSYIPENIVIAGVTFFDGWYYLTMPRMKQGVPATLGRIHVNDENNTAPLIAPFPSWELNKLNDCNAIQNVQNAEISPNGEMWIIDGGHANSLTSAPIRNCSPKLIIFDITNGKSVLVHIFSEDVASKNANFLYDIVVDLDNQFAYITDNSRDDPGIIVFSRKENQSWKIRHSPSMKADSAAQKFEVCGVPISAPINIAGIALSTRMNNSKERDVYYCPLSSLHLYSVSTSILQNKSNSNPNFDNSSYIKDIGVKASQSDGMIMSNQGALYYGLLSDNSIARWDSHTPFATNQKLLSRDFSYIQWTNSFTIDLEGNLIVLTNTLQKFIYQSLSINSTNFWLLSAKIAEKSYLYDDTNYNSSNTVNQTRQVHENSTYSNSTMSQDVANATANIINDTVSVNKISLPSGSDCKLYNVFVVILLTVLCFSL